MYQKDHLFNSNPSWDFGAFRRLQILMKQTNLNSTRFVESVLLLEPHFSHTASLLCHKLICVPLLFLRFAHVFSAAGKYAFVDSAVPERSMVVVVSDQGTVCDPRASVFQPMTPAQLVKHGIIKQHRLNLLPDWGVIAGVYHHCSLSMSH